MEDKQPTNQQASKQSERLYNPASQPASQSSKQAINQPVHINEHILPKRDKRYLVESMRKPEPSHGQLIPVPISSLQIPSGDMILVAVRIPSPIHSIRTPRFLAPNIVPSGYVNRVFRPPGRVETSVSTGTVRNKKRIVMAKKFSLV